MNTLYKEINFRDTEVGRIPLDWQIKPLGKSDFVELSNGRRPKFSDSGKIPVYGANGIMGYSEIALVDTDFTIVIGRVGASGKIHLASGAAWISDNAIYSSKYHEKLIDMKFLSYLLSSTDLSALIRKTTHVLITQGSLNLLKIPLPPPEEQRNISSMLQIIDEAIQETNEIIAKTQRLKQGLMQELLTKGIGHKEFKETEIGILPQDWKVVKIGDITQVRNGSTPRTSVKEYWTNGTIPWVPTGRVNERIIEKPHSMITEKAFSECNMRWIPKDSLLMAMIGQGLTRGKVAKLLFDATINQNFAAIFPSSAFDTDFLFHYFDFIYSQIRNLGRGGNQWALNCELVRQIKIPLPQKVEQKQIANILSHSDFSIRLEEKERAKLEKIKEGFMDLLLTGKIRVKTDTN